MKHDMGDEKTIKEIIAEVDTDNVKIFTFSFTLKTPEISNLRSYDVVCINVTSSKWKQI